MHKDLRDLVSHRVSFLYEDGTRLVGYVASVRPSQGTQRVVSLSRAEIYDEEGHLIEQHREFNVIAAGLTGWEITEGPC